MKKPAFFVTLLICTVLVLSGVQIVVSNQLATNGLYLSNLQNKVRNLDKKNYELAEKVYNESSLTHIASVAATMGLNNEKTLINLSNPLPLAVKQ